MWFMTSVFLSLVLLVPLWQKIHIKEGPRKGDWEVIAITERKAKLRCPVSLREVEWDRFCYSVEEGEDIEWPQRD